MLSESTKNKIRGLGVDPDQMMQQLSNYIGEGRSFASPQDYATAIQGKRATGQPLTDPQTARDFQRVAPQLFGEKPQPQQTEFPFSVGQIPQGLKKVVSPEAHGMLDALAQYQEENPFTIPYAPGTPTIAQTEFNESIRQFDLAHELAKRQQEHKEWLDRQSLALQRARLASAGLSGAGSRGGAFTPSTPWEGIDMIVSLGADIDTVMRYVDQNVGEYKKHGTSRDDMREYARDAFTSKWQGALDVSGVPKGASPADTMRGFRQAERASSNIMRADSWGIEPEMPKYMSSDYETFADLLGTTVGNIMDLERYGLLDTMIKEYYAREYGLEG